MGILERVHARASSPNRRKSWSEPPFWATQDLLNSRWPNAAAANPENESLDVSFQAYIQEAYKANGIVFSCIDRRQQVFSQARFQWQRIKNGRPGDMYGTTELGLLEKPGPNFTTGEMLARMEIDASLAGNSYWTTVDDFGRVGKAASGPTRRMVRMRPDWVTLIIGGPSNDPYALDARVMAYSFLPKPRSGYNRVVREPVILLPNEVCHYSPKPDPDARFLGMSWLTPIITDILGDLAATRHKMKFFQNGATPSLSVQFDKDVPPRDLDLYKKKFDDMHSGVDNAYQTLFFGGGADVTPLTVDLRQLDFKVTQGAGETRMAVGSGVPAVILGISEGLSGSSLNEGNFRAAKRLFVDATIQDLWRKAAPSLQVLLSKPADGSELVTDGRDIPFLRENADDQASIRAQDATVIRTLGDGGWEPDSIIAYMATSDVSRLVHSGMVPVQLQPAKGTPAGTPGLNGSSNGLVPVAPRGI